MCIKNNMFPYLQQHYLVAKPTASQEPTTASPVYVASPTESPTSDPSSVPTFPTPAPTSEPSSFPTTPGSAIRQSIQPTIPLFIYLSICFILSYLTG